MAEFVYDRRAKSQGADATQWVRLHVGNERSREHRLAAAQYGAAVDRESIVQHDLKTVLRAGFYVACLPEGLGERYELVQRRVVRQPLAGNRLGSS